MNYSNELAKIKGLVSEDVWDLFVDYDVIIGGGAITSVFCNREVNDLDIYLRSSTSFFQIIFDIYSGGHILIASNMTNRSILFRDKETKQDVQLIIYKFFNNTDELFNDYDFTINMGALECSTEKFYFDEEFFKHNSQRYLQFHTNTTYPLISLLRVQKYIDKGYTISKAQMLRILLTISKLNFTTWDEIKDHCGGFYGLNMDEVFPEDREFSIDLVIETLDEVFGDNKFKTYFESITEDQIFDKFLSFYGDNRVSAKEKFFKNVGVKDDIMYSIHTPSFTYKLNEIVNGGKNGIYCYAGYDVLGGIYNNYSSGNLIIELEELSDSMIKSEKTINSIFPEPLDKIQLLGDVKVIAVYTKTEFISKFTNKS